MVESHIAVQSWRTGTLPEICSATCTRTLYPIQERNMSTIEIISLDSRNLGTNQRDFDVAIIEENELISHRGLFCQFLKKYQGTILHIGNPEFKQNKDGGFFGGDLIDWILWNDWDPIGVNDYGGPSDEYRSYLSEIYKLLKETNEEEKIAKHLDSIVTEQMGMSSNMKENLIIARLLLEKKREYE